MMKALWILLLAVPAFGEPSTNGAFQVGETLKYNIFWGPIIAGKATLQVLGIETIDGHPCYHLRAHAKTFGLANLIYPVNSSMDSWLDVEGLFTRRHQQNRLEGGKPVRDIGMYDYIAGRVTITNLVSGRVKYSDLAEPVRDAVSAVYYLRTQSLQINATNQFLVQDGVTNCVVTAIPDERRKIEVRPLGEVAALRIEPKPTLQIVADHKGRMWFWVSHDHRKLPMLAVCSLPIGNARFVLERMEKKAPAAMEDLSLVKPPEPPVVAADR